MKKDISSFVISTLLSLLLSGTGLCLDGESIIRLKKAGISDGTIEVIMKEKIVETCAYTVQEILDLKNAGLSDETIRKLMMQGSFIKNSEHVVYGKDIKSIKFSTVEDIIELKKAGLSDSVIRAIIIYASQDSEESEREKAWDMLKNMGVIVDKR